MLHGLTASGNCWSETAHFLDKDYDIIMPDARGHGESAYSDSGYSYEDNAEDISGLIKSLGLKRPVLLGHSMGGMTAAVVASRSPELPGGLVLADPAFLSIMVQQDIRSSDITGEHRRTLEKSIEELTAELQIKHPLRSPELIRHMARAKLQTRVAAFDVLTPPNPDFKLLVGTIKVPTLLIFGDKGVMTCSSAREIQNINPLFQIVQIPGAGHGLHYDRPEAFANAVRSFISSLECKN